MRKKIKIVISLFAISTILILSSSCRKNQTGVCTGYSSDYNSTYCYDGWTKEECEEWNSLNVNGVDWYFHEGQTCSERGL